MENQTGNHNKSQTTDKAPTKKSYSPPQLVNYGDLAALTQSGGSGGTEGLSGMAMA